VFSDGFGSGAPRFDGKASKLTVVLWRARDDPANSRLRGLQ
jgi:hypothetical protein